MLRIASEQLSARQLAAVTSEVTGKKFKLLWAGTLGTLGLMIKVMRAIKPAPHDTFSPWQGMQYTRDMFSGRGKLEPLDNDRYPGLQWTKVREFLVATGRGAAHK